MSSLDKLHFSNTFATLPEIFFSPHQPQALSEDFLIHCNLLVAELLGIDKSDVEQSDFLDIFTTKKTISWI